VAGRAAKCWHRIREYGVSGGSWEVLRFPLQIVLLLSVEPRKSTKSSLGAGTIESTATKQGRARVENIWKKVDERNRGGGGFEKKKIRNKIQPY
jgi:hypothetical protein